MRSTYFLDRKLMNIEWACWDSDGYKSHMGRGVSLNIVLCRDAGRDKFCGTRKTDLISNLCRFC